MSHEENLQTVMAISGLDVENAGLLLTETNGDLEMASNLFFSGAWQPFAAQPQQQDVRPTTSANQDRAEVDGGGPSRGRKHDRHADEDLEEEMRAPIASKVDRLYGGGGWDVGGGGYTDPRMMQQASAANYGVQGRGKAVQPVDIFRDLEESGPGKNGKETSLSKLFQLPKDLVFKGGLEMAKMRGEQEGKWILLSIQTNSSFDSHRLNRDVWSQDLMSSIVKGSFIFLQEDDSVPEGQRLVTMYRLEKLPATLVLDPLTGSMLHMRAGFVDVDRMTEELMPFLDVGPKDPSAGQLAISLASKAKKAAEAAATSRAPTTSRAPQHTSEDDEIQAAIRMSLGMSKEGPVNGKEGPSSSKQPNVVADDSEEEMDEDAIWAAIKHKEEEEAALKAKDPQTVKAEAEARLPVEPDMSAAGVVRVAVRMTDGSRITRRFDHKDKVASLFDWLLSSSLEVAGKGGKGFDLVAAEPGAKPLANPYDGGGEVTLEGAGLSVSVLLVIKWRG